MRTPSLTIAVGLAVGAAALVVLLTGGGWWALWLAVLSAAVVTRPVIRRYWERVDRDDPGSVPLRVMWMSAGFVAITVLLGIALVTGVGFHTSTGRGLLMFVAAFFFGIAWWKAKATRIRMRASDLSADDE